MKTSPSKLLAVPDSFRNTALSFPKKITQALALLDDPEVAAEMLAKAETMAHYARRVRVDTEVINAIQYGKLLIQAKLGELMPTTGGRPKKADEKKSVPGTGFSSHTIATYRKVAEHAGELESYRDRIDKATEEADKNSPDVPEISTAAFIRFVGSDGNIKSNQNKGVIEWFTPARYVDLAREVMGGIDLDPASNKKANAVVKARRFFDKKNDGLSRQWKGNVFLNPPFQAALMQAFVEKLCESYEAGDVQQAVLLTNNNTDTGWWHQAAGRAAGVCFTRGRVNFSSPAGEIAQPTNGQTFFYFGRRDARFAKSFAAIGTVMVRK